MANERRGNLWLKVLVGVAIACFLLSTPCLFAGVLGFLGVFADVGPAENRQMGFQLLRIAAIPIGLGVVVSAIAIIVWRSRPR